MKIVSYGDPVFTKFCPPEFNIKKGCNTVFFGTLFGYRNIEDEKLRDAGEGTFTYSLSFPELTKVSSEWIQAFELDVGGEFNCGKLEMRAGEMYVESIALSGSSHNCWVYCISKSVDSAGDITETHQDKWLIPGRKLQPLVNHLAAILWAEVGVADLPADIAGAHTLQEIQQRLSMHAEVREIEYVERDLIITAEEQLSISGVHDLRAKIPFIKPKYFEPENELRIAFWLLFDGKKISIVDKPKIVELRPIDKII